MLKDFQKLRYEIEVLIEIIKSKISKIFGIKRVSKEFENLMERWRWFENSSAIKISEMQKEFSESGLSENDVIQATESAINLASAAGIDIEQFWESVT